MQLEVSRFQDMVDVVPATTPDIAGTDGTLTVVVALTLLAVAIAVVVWRSRSRQSQAPGAGPEAGLAAPPATTPSPSPASASPSARPAPSVSEGPPFDPVKALDLCGEDEDLLRTVVEEIPEEIDSQMKQLRGALAEKNASELHVAAHRLKGSLLLIAADASAAAALSIELAGREGNLTNVAADVDRLEAEVVRLKAAISEYLRPAS